MANLRKPASQRTGKAGTTRDFGVVRGGKHDAPPCPTLLGGVKPLSQTVEAWRRLWESDLSGVLDLKSDLDTVERWASLIDERERAFRAYRKQRMVPGSMGQAVLSPLWGVVKACDAELRSLEDRIGLSPRARLQLGITFAEAGRSLDELNRLLEDTDADAPNVDNGQRAQADPRVAAIEARASSS